MPDFAFEGFEIAELIGFGASGQVYRARDLRSGETVALKRLPPGAVDVVDRLRRAAALAREADHGHVVTVREVVVSDGDVVLVMDYAPGGSLAEVLSRRGRLEPGEAVTMLSPVATALGGIHRAGGVHGNLTPANILIAGDGRPLLADVGVAVALDVDLAVIDATADFRDPALFLGGTPTAVSDVFSLGAIGFAALAGRPPQIGNDRLSRFAPDLPRSLIALIEAAIDADEVARPTAQQFADALITACRAEPLDATARGPVEPGAPPSTGPATRTLRLTGPLPPPPPRPGPAEVGGSLPPKPRGGRLSAGPPAPERPARRPVGRSRPNRRPTGARLAAGAIVAFGVLLLGSAGWGHLRHSATGGDGAAAGAAARVPATGSIAPVRVTPRVPTLPTALSSTLSSTPASGSAPITSAARWRGIVAYLDATRAQAFATAQPSLLRDVYADRVPALAVDQASVRSLARRGLRAVGFAATVERIEVRSESQTAVTLRVVDRLSSYRLVDATGATVGTGAGRPARAYTMTLVRTPAGWRVSAVLP